MARTLIETTDYIVADNHPTLSPIKDRQLREIWASFVLEHDRNTGQHLAPFDSFGIDEIDTYSGTGAEQDIVLTGNLSDIQIVAIIIWSEATGALYFHLSDMLKTKVSTDNASPLIDAVTNLGVGEFSLGEDTEVNDNGVTYYFAAFGSGQTPDTGDRTSAPAWIGHNVAMLGGNESQSGNSVEYAIDTKLQIEHNEDGTHKSTAFNGVGWFEKNSFIPDGTAAQEVSLENEDLEIQAILLMAEDTHSPYYKTLDMSKMRQFTNSALAGSGFLSLGTGKFTIDGTQKFSPEAMLILADQANGFTSFPDSSSFVHNVFTASTGQSPASIDWTNTAAAVGSTSIHVVGKFLNVNFAEDFNNDFDISCYYKGDTNQHIPTMCRFQVISDSPAKIAYIGFGHNSEDVTDNRLHLIVLPASSLSKDTPSKSAQVGGGGSFTGNLAGATEGSHRFVIDGGATGVNTKDNAWHTVVLQRINGIVYLYVDGALQASTTSFKNALATPTFSVGMFYEPIPSYNSTGCYMDEITINRTDPIFSNILYHYMAFGRKVVPFAGDYVYIGSDQVLIGLDEVGME